MRRLIRDRRLAVALVARRDRARAGRGRAGAHRRRGRGAGLADTTLVASDGLTWLGDDRRGEVTQVNPATGRPEVRLKVAPPGTRSTSPNGTACSS